MRQTELDRAILAAQQSDTWIAARCGRITGSGVQNLLAKPTTRKSTRNGVEYPAGSEAREKEEYRNQLIIERIYKRTTDHYTSQYMKDGTDREPAARMLYEAINNVQVEQVGFQLHPEWDWFGCSPDGLVGDDGGLELKCPTEATHDSYVQDIKNLLNQYYGQCLAGLMCFPERQWWDLYSFNPYAPPKIMLVGCRLYRHNWMEIIESVKAEALKMNDEIENEICDRGLPPTVWGKQ